MTKTFAERCHIAQQFLPDAQYKAMLTALHTEMLAALAEQPAQYPEGDVVGPCVCGSWPGGECLKCPRIEQPAQGEKK